MFLDGYIGAPPTSTVFSAKAGGASVAAPSTTKPTAAQSAAIRVRFIVLSKVKMAGANRTGSPDPPMRPIKSRWLLIRTSCQERFERKWICRPPFTHMIVKQGLDRPPIALAVLSSGIVGMFLGWYPARIAPRSDRSVAASYLTITNLCRPLKPSCRPRVSPRSSATEKLNAAQESDRARPDDPGLAGRRVGSRRLPQNGHDMNAPLSWNAPRMIKVLT